MVLGLISELLVNGNSTSLGLEGSGLVVVWEMGIMSDSNGNSIQLVVQSWSSSLNRRQV